MKDTRRGESGPHPFRSGRIFSVGSEWYFATREDGDQGPFHSRAEAEAELRLYVRLKVTEDQQLSG